MLAKKAKRSKRAKGRTRPHDGKRGPRPWGDINGFEIAIDAAIDLLALLVAFERLTGQPRTERLFAERMKEICTREEFCTKYPVNLEERKEHPELVEIRRNIFRAACNWMGPLLDIDRSENPRGEVRGLLYGRFLDGIGPDVARRNYLAREVRRLDESVSMKGKTQAERDQLIAERFKLGNESGVRLLRKPPALKNRLTLKDVEPRVLK